MTTAQEPLAGPRVPSFFKSVLHDLAKIVIPSPDKLSSVHSVRRERGAHSALRTPSRRISAEPSPHRPAELRGAKEDQRCQFTFADGRQCRHQRAQLCPQHASRAKNDPLATDEDKNQIDLPPPKEAAFQSPELEALCADLTTATNINRALTQVFLLLAQGRISQKQAVAFGYLAQLLLQTLPGIRGEFVSVFGYSAWEANLKPKLTMRPSSSRAPDRSEESLSDRRTVLGPSTQEDRPSSSVAQRAKESAPAPAVNSRSSAPPPAASPGAPKTRKVPGAPFDGAGETEIASAVPVQKRVAPPTPSAIATTAAPASESSALHSETPQMQMPSAGFPSPAVASALPPERRFVAPTGIPDDAAGLPEPIALPSPAVAPAATAPAAKKPRMIWVERMQQFVPESSLL